MSERRTGRGGMLHNQQARRQNPGLIPGPPVDPNLVNALLNDMLFLSSRTRDDWRYYNGVPFGHPSYEDRTRSIPANSMFFRQRGMFGGRR